MGTQEDKDDFVTLSDEFLSRTGALEDDIEKKMEDDWKKLEDGQATRRMNREDDDRMVTSLAEKIVNPGDQPQTNLGVVQGGRTNTNLGMVGYASTVVGVEDATVQVATDHRTNLHGDHSLASQTIFVRSGEKESILVSGSEQRAKKHKKMNVGDSKILDNTLELVEAEITDDLVENNGSTTAPSSGEKVSHVVTPRRAVGHRSRY